MTRVLGHGACVVLALLTLALDWTAAEEPPVAAILTGARSRTAYLANARMWRDPGTRSPDDIVAGPRAGFPYSAEEALAGVDCTFARPGKDLGGDTPKFLCAAGGGRSLRLKYWDPERRDGNREVFSIVAATRLMWALGFEVLNALPLNVRCRGCPANPMTGDGPRASRNYAAELSLYPPDGPMILSHEDRDQGWSWRELDQAIDTLPPGPARTRQRTHFDALALLGVFIQHGDRKAPQQMLYCASPVDMTAGERRRSKGDGVGSILVERTGVPACATPAAVIVDLGSTLGGAGRTSNDVTAAMNVEAWRRKTIFKPDDRGCRGELTVSIAAGRDGEGNPNISEQGRLFFLEQLRRLTPSHVRAIFTAARADLLPRSGVDEWVDAFQEKVREIESRRCEP